jgi:hypothetical protein
MPGKMARSNPRPSVRVTRGAGKRSAPRVCLARGPGKREHDAGLGFIWRISVLRKSPAAFWQVDGTEPRARIICRNVWRAKGPGRGGELGRRDFPEL